MPKTFSLADCARDVADILAANDIERASVVAVSMGGLIAQQMACDFPDKVEKLVIVDSFSGVRGISGKINAGMASFLLKVLPGSLQSKLLTTTYSRMGHPEVALYFEEQMGKVNGRSLREMRAVVNQFDILDRLSSVVVPTLVLVGDGFGKSAIEMARDTAAAVPNAQFEILPGGGDPSNLLVPDKFDAAVLSFLAGQGVVK
jgi:3-oxoadipate enol-lactonase